MTSIGEPILKPPPRAAGIHGPNSSHFKPYPCGSIAQPYMDCALRVRDVHRMRSEDIVEIRCRTADGPVPRLWEPLTTKHAPQNGYAANFSLPYLLAVILTRGRASLAEFEDDVVRDPEILALASRVGYEIDPTIDYPRQFVGHVRVRLRDGRVIEEWQDHPRAVRTFRWDGPRSSRSSAVTRALSSRPTRLPGWSGTSRWWPQSRVFEASRSHGPVGSVT
jgi:2-methylcitrate dehydratase PrpD